MGAAKAKRVGDEVRLVDAVDEEGFVVLNTQLGYERAAREKKQQAGGQSGTPGVENSGEPIHLMFARLSICAFSKEKY